jgi:hypothetical protein
MDFESNHALKRLSLDANRPIAPCKAAQGLVHVSNWGNCPLFHVPLHEKSGAH